MLSGSDTNKKMAGEEAVNYIEDGMIVGLGSGSTVNFMLKKLGERVKEGLKVKGIPTSIKTERLARELGIPLIESVNIERIDLAIDGADEVDNDLHLLKGGGGSLVREKIVDEASDKLIIIIDGLKKVSHLGAFSLPIEIVPFGWKLTEIQIKKLGGIPTLRKKNDEIFVSDNGNFILDCDFGQITDPQQLHYKLKLLTGVVETGLFVSITDKVIIGRNSRVDVLHRSHSDMEADLESTSLLHRRNYSE
ncbi:ribose-5-phosphate isomerase RpiA [Virgibacillus kekensis]|uniref:Ribose-5-phosphate isomerase A n=1 Tax=Virgibacillus kekensis TaxID=202261 RepID=A0ABV9DG03_9BACI